MAQSLFHICNPSTPEPSGSKNIISKKELQEIRDDSNAVYLLNVHLNWERNKLSSNYGFDIANLIRTEKKSKAPIIFYSPIQKEYFESKSKKGTRYKILFGRGTGFIEMPFTEDKLTELVKGIEPLSNAALHDVATMLCDLKGIVIDRLNHDLKPGADIDMVIDSVSVYLNLQQKQAIRLAFFQNELRENNYSDKWEAFLSVKQSFITKCNIHLHASGNNADDIDRKMYKVLVLDDRREELDIVEQNLGDDFEFTYTSKATEALSILENDLDNTITAVICDWRLYTDESQSYWQSLQGYEVLEYAAGNGIRALFALTSQADFVVHQIRNIQNIKFQLFKKENLQHKEQWKLFSDILYEACDEAFSTITNMPGSKMWDNPIRGGQDLGTSLKREYIKMRNTQPARFDEISSMADALMENLETSIKEGMSNTLGEISTKKINQDSLIQVLIQRRIWLALFEKGFNSERIYGIMEAQPRYKADKNSLNQHKNKLCILENDVKNYKILPEEKSWLKKWNLCVRISKNNLP